MTDQTHNQNHVSDNEELTTFEHRKNTLEELIIYLNGSLDDLHKYPVETVVEGFWMLKQRQALIESRNFELEGE